MANSRNSKKSRGKSSKSSNGTFVFILYAVCVIVGVVLGGILYRQLTKNDGFTLVGQEEITLRLGEDTNYVDPGASLVWFGKDFSERISVETNLTKSGDGYVFDPKMPGSYYISYTTDMREYEGVTLTRIIRVTEDDTMGG